MKVLVTGGAGFIGSHVVDAYVTTGHEVAVVDNLSTGRRDYLNPTARFHDVDLRNPDLRAVFEQEGPEIVSHQAAQPSVIVSTERPGDDADINIAGTVHLLSLCDRYHVRRFVFASTGGAIYGDPARVPADESQPAQPLSPYAISKLAGEYYVQYFGARGMSTMILRYANVYGPRQDPYGEAGVIAIFTQSMLDGKMPRVNGDGNQTRDFLYVADAAAANVAAIQTDRTGVVNIGTSVETSVNEIYRLLSTVTGYRGEVTHGPPKVGEVYRIALDASRARDWLGWTPDTPLATGLQKTVEWFRTHPRH